MEKFKITVHDYNEYYFPEFDAAFGVNPNQLPREDCPSGKVAVIEGTLKDLPFCIAGHKVVDSGKVKQMTDEEIEKMVYVGDLTVDEAIKRSQVVECF